MRLVPVLLVLLLGAPSAAAASPVSGTLQFDAPFRIDGEATLGGPYAVLDLSEAVRAGETLTLSWSSAVGYEVQAAWTITGDVRLRDKVDNASLGFGAGRLESVSCGRTCRVFAFGLGGVHTLAELEGSYAGIPPRLERVEKIWAEFQPQASLVPGAPATPQGFGYGFYHELAPGTLVAGGEWTSNASARALGRIGLLLADAHAEVDAVDNRTRIGTIHERQPGSGPAGLPMGERVKSGYAYLVLENAVLETGAGTRALLYAQRPVVDLDGALDAPAVSGHVVVDGQKRALRQDALRVEGALRLALDQDTGLASEAAPLRGGLAGEADVVRVGSQALVQAQDSNAVATGAAAVGLLALLWLVLQRGGLTFLYSRINRASVLGNPRRRQVYDLIRERPGATATDLAAATGLARVVVQHHLRMLETHNMVTPRREGRRRAYFAVGQVPTEDMLSGHAALRDASRRRVAQLLVTSTDPLTQAALAGGTGLSQRLVSYHLAHLQELGLVTAEGALPRRYRPTTLLRRVFEGGWKPSGQAEA